MSEEKDFDLVSISLGAGVQSSTLYRMAALGEIPGRIPDVAIFADTQSEPRWVYEQLDSLEADHGDVIPIVRATTGDLGSDLIHGKNSTGQRFASVPFWVESRDGAPTPTRRQCTREYKIDVVRRAIRERLGLKSGQRAAGKFRVEEWVGISLDEVTRAKPSRDSWIETRWPLLYDVPMRRSDCLEWCEKHGFPIPKKSAYTFCPYRHDVEYALWRVEEPDLFEEACRIDDAIRESGALIQRGMKNPQFVSRSLIPLRDLPPVEELDNREQIDLWDNECEGMCGV